MKSIKSKILVFLSFLFSIFFVGSAFSAYIFSERTNLHTDKAKGLMDDISNNFELDANSYTVYFFPSSKWADYMKANPKPASQSLDDYLSVDNYKNYLKTEVFKNSDETNNPSDEDIAKIYGYFPDDEDPYGYKVRYADICISTDTFDQMTVPLTTAKDSQGHWICFSGWTANFNNAIIYGYNSQGMYDYISSYDELSTVVKDQAVYTTFNIPKTVFVFPVLTAGKEYNGNGKGDNFNGQKAVRIHDRDARKVNKDNPNSDMYFGRELYFSQTGKNDSAYYFYNNLKVKDNEMLYLDFAFGGDWYNFKNVGGEGGWTASGYHAKNSQDTKKSEKWDGEDYKYQGSEKYKINPLFDTRLDANGKRSKLGDCAVNQPGVYNIYAYICESGNENNVPAAFKDKNLTNSSLVWYEDTSVKSYGTTVGYKEGYYVSIYNIYVKIEKILEFGLSGGRTKSLQYVDALQMISSSQIKPADNETTTNTSSRYYILNNVFLEGKDINETITANNKNDSSFYTYPSSVSAILKNDDTPIEFSALKPTQDQLDTFQEAYNKVYGNDTIYNFKEIYNTSSLHYSEYSIVEDNNVTSLFGNSNKRIFIQPAKSGFYSVVAKMTMTRKQVTDTNLTTDTKHTYELTFEKCQIAICLGTQIKANVFLYNKGDTIKKADGKFIDVKSTGNWYAKATTVEYGKPLTYDTVFTLKDGTTKKLRDILGVSETTVANHLTNHLTGREFKFNSAGESIQLRRNYAFYIMPGAWQEGEKLV